MMKMNLTEIFYVVLCVWVKYYAFWSKAQWNKHKDLFGGL